MMSEAHWYADPQSGNATVTVDLADQPFSAAATPTGIALNTPTNRLLLSWDRVLEPAGDAMWHSGILNVTSNRGTTRVPLLPEAENPVPAGPPPVWFTTSPQTAGAWVEAGIDHSLTQPLVTPWSGPDAILHNRRSCAPEDAHQLNTSLGNLLGRTWCTDCAEADGVLVTNAYKFDKATRTALSLIHISEPTRPY